MKFRSRRRRPDADAGNDRSDHSAFYRFGIGLAHHAWSVIACWLVLVVAATFLIPRFEARLTGPPLDVSGSESDRAEELLETRFEHPFAEQDLVVFASDTLTVDDPAYRTTIEKALRTVDALPLVAGVIGPFDPRARDQISIDRHAAAAIIGLSGGSSERQRLAPLLAAAATTASTDDVRVYITGPSPLIAEMVKQQEGDLAQAERAGLPVAVLVLVLASGTLVAAGLPLLLGIVGIAVTLGVLGAATFLTDFNLFVPNITTMLGLGVGIDYSLFIVTRYREELARGATPLEAVAGAVATSGKTVFVSGATVVLSLGGLLLVDAPIARQLSVGAMTGVAVMIAGALTLLPAVLAVLGRRVERLVLPWLRHPADHAGADDGFWARWARAIMRHPVRWGLAAVLLLAALSAPVTRLHLGLTTGTNEISTDSAVAGRAVLAQEFNEGRVSPIQVIFQSPDGPLDDQDLQAVARLTSALRVDGEVADVVSVTDALHAYAGDYSGQALANAGRIPAVAEALAPLVNFSRGGDVTIVSVVPYAPPDSDPATQLVRRIRSEVAPEAVSGTNLRVLVGGLGAQVVDLTDESQQKLPIVGGFVVALSFLLLAVVFRSLVLPLKAILMNGLSIGAAYGLLVVVFQRPAGHGILHLTPTGTTQVYLPLLTFAVLFGLSMDYEVFLLGRIKEEWERTGDNTSAVALGLQRSARVITSAAAIMVTVFAAFTFTPLPEIQQLGFSLATAVLIDATLVRIVLVPASMQLLGHWNWWFPSWLDAHIPRIDLAEAGVGRPLRVPPTGHGAATGDA